jgi:hypothetical protein
MGFVKVGSSATTGELGMAILAGLISGDLGWLFRRQHESDYGIDAQVEVVDDGHTLGRLLALQVKSGQSYLKERVKDGFVFRPDRSHVEYWLAHSLPVLVVLVDPDAGQAWWQHVSRSTVESTGKGWKLIVPDNQLLSSASSQHLATLADADPYVLKLRQLQLAKPWMKLLEDGGRIVLDVDEWVNKSSGRASLELITYDADDRETSVTEWPYLIFPFANYAIELPRLFPWADLSVDEATYEEGAEGEYEAECGVWDPEDQRYYYRQTFEAWRSSRQPAILYPYEEDGEIARWRLQFALGHLGKAFLALDALLEEGLLPLA